MFGFSQKSRSMKYSLLLLLALFLNCYANVKTISIDGCKKIVGLPGPEDLAIDRETGILYISSHERRGTLVEGKLFQINLNSPTESVPTLIETNYPNNFHPHGMSLVKINGKLMLYVISHPSFEPFTNTIEVFQIEKNKVKHVETIQSDTFISLNDLYVMPDGRIFASNDRGTGSMFRSYFDAFFGIKRSQITYFNLKNWTLLDNKVTYGNGILYKKIKDKEYLYRAATTAEKIYKYELSQNGDTVTLKEVKVINLDSGPDNLEEDEKGDIYIAAHKSMFRFLKHVDKPDYPSPSQIFVLDNNDNLKEIYANDGTEIPASSTGLRYKNRLYISQVFNPYLLSCPLN